jgi:outer membrane protein assembly factor BamB
VFTLGIDGDLRAWDAADGREAWSLNLYDTFGVGQRPRVGRAARRDYGYKSSPLVLDDAVIVEVGDDEGSLMAFSAQNGKRLWTSQSREPAGHSGSPVPIVVEGVPCVAVLGIRQLLVARLDAGHEGQTLATYPWETNFANNIPTPAVEGPFVLVTSKYNHESICKLKITRAGAEKVWEAPYASGVCSPLVHKGRVYWSSHRAYCLDFATGKLIWEGGRFGDAGSCLVTSDERLIVWAGSGVLALVDVSGSANSYRELVRREFPAPSDVWPHVVLTGGRLYCKTREGTLTCW